MKEGFSIILSMLTWVLLALPASGQEGAGGESCYVGFHRHLDYSFRHNGTVTSEQRWEDVRSPRKFSQEVVLDLAGAELRLMVFDLAGETGEWWLSEVMGFLFDPDATVDSDLSAQGYEVYRIHIPGGQGIYPQTEVLLVGPGGAWRMTCIRCEELGALEPLQRIIDSFVATSRTATEP